MSFEIITDSAANLPEDMISKYKLNVLSLVFYVKEKEYYSYEDGKTTDLVQFYKMMRDKENITTSLPNLDLAQEKITKLLEAGKDVLYIGFSSGLSGTYQAVSMLLEQLKEDYPNQKIYYLDTYAAALGEGLLVTYAAKQREEGKTIEQVRDWLLNNRLNLCHWFTVDDLFFLQRGGRVSQVAAVFGSMLNIKPVLHVDDEGHLIVMEKARGRKKSLDALIKHMQETIIEDENAVIYISHGDCREDAEYVAKKIDELYPGKEVLVHILDPVIGAHSGPGTVALFFVGTKR